MITQRRRNVNECPRASRATSPATSPERELKPRSAIHSPTKQKCGVAGSSPCKRVMILSSRPPTAPPSAFSMPPASSDEDMATRGGGGGGGYAAGAAAQAAENSSESAAFVSCESADEFVHQSPPARPPPARLPMLSGGRRRSLSTVADRAQKDGLKKLGMGSDSDGEDDDGIEGDQSPVRRRRAGGLPPFQKGLGSPSRRARRDRQQQQPLERPDPDEEERVVTPVKPRRLARKALTPVAEPGETPYRLRQQREGPATPNSRVEPMRRLDSFASP